jgi:hypothetical protein
VVGGRNDVLEQEEWHQYRRGDEDRVEGETDHDTEAARPRQGPRLGEIEAVEREPDLRPPRDREQGCPADPGNRQ